MKPGQKLGWGFLPNTEGEANGFAAAAGRRMLTAVRLEGDKATTDAVLAALPRAKYAHFATHGFFADPSFRSASSTSTPRTSRIAAASGSARRR